MRRCAKQATPKLRVIGGQWRGRKLQFPDRPGLRPTGDRIRETLFNWLGPHLHNTDREAITAVDHHLNTLNATDSSSVRCDMAERYLRQTEDKWDIVFIDPPFDARLGMSTLTLLASSDRLAEASRVYFETSRSQPEPVPEGRYDVLREKTTGDVYYRLLSPR